ncbi:EamA/RhaT family transporter, partial [Vibrio alginolyticus]|nr:EamA/RhaT family transporter [Vibrio alginolyticus]
MSSLPGNYSADRLAIHLNTGLPNMDMGKLGMNERRALGLGLSAVLLWSTVATAFKLTLAEFSP